MIGINSQIATSGGSKGNVGIGFAIPVNLARQIIPKLIKNGKVEHAYIGVTTTTVTAQVAKALKLPTQSGALVEAIAPGSPAAKAGIRAGSQPVQGLVAGGDVIVAIDGKPVRSSVDVGASIAGKAPGQRVRLDFYRGTTRKSVTVTLANRPNKAP